MCGIVGIMTKQKAGFYNSDLNLFKNMLVVDSLRGEDSTGVYGIFKNLQAKTIKVAAEPHMLFRTEEWHDFERKAVNSMRILVGHNRYATKGAVNNKNAHPFDVGNIVLVHNGTIHNQKDFNKEVEVDSHAIAHALNEKPAEEVLSEIDGAFALVWYNRTEGKVFFARNTQRPLYYIDTPNNIYFGSEGTMLEFILNRTPGNIQYKAYAFPTGKIISYDTKGVSESKDFDIYSPKSYGGYNHTYLPKSIHGNSITPNTTVVDASVTRLTYNTKVLLSISSLKVEANGYGACTGKIVSPVNDTDFSGQFEKSLLDSEILDLAGSGRYAEGVISGSISTSCGLSYYVQKVQPAATVAVYNKSKLPKILWDHICKNNKCDKCGSEILTHEADMTSVKVKNLTNKFRVVCSTCVMEALDEKTKPSNIQNSYSTVQDYKQVSKHIENWVDASSQEISIIH
jgi:predicted DNA-binding ribbon-helix-helix protein